MALRSGICTRGKTGENQLPLINKIKQYQCRDGAMFRASHPLLTAKGWGHSRLWLDILPPKAGPSTLKSRESRRIAKRCTGRARGDDYEYCHPTFDFSLDSPHLQHSDTGLHL